MEDMGESAAGRSLSQPCAAASGPINILQSADGAKQSSILLAVHVSTLLFLSGSLSYCLSVN